jgi:hypothetical protein
MKRLLVWFQEHCVSGLLVGIVLMSGCAGLVNESQTFPPPKLPPGVKPSTSPPPAPGRIQRPEASMWPVRILNTGQGFGLIPKEGFEYLSETTTSRGGSFDAIPSIDRVNRWLHSSNYKCMQSIVFSWDGTSTGTWYETAGEKRVVIECRGDCREVRYSLGARSSFPITIDHFGLSQPMPVLHFIGPYYADGYTVQWRFTRPTLVGDGPQIAIHIWSGGLFLGEEDVCRLDK